MESGKTIKNSTMLTWFNEKSRKKPQKNLKKTSKNQNSQQKQTLT
jgi:hypothetical protein